MFSMGQLISTLGGTVFLRLCGAIGGLSVQILLARMLAPEEMGIFFLATSVGALLALAYTGGYNTVGLTYLSRYMSLGRQKLRDTFIAAAVRDLSTNAILMTIITMVVISGFNFSEETRLAVYTGLIVAPAAAIMYLQSTVANASRRYFLAFAPSYFFRPSALLIAVLALPLYSAQPKLSIVLMLYAFIAYATLLAQTCCLCRNFITGGGKINCFKLPLRTSKKRLAAWRSRAAALTIVTLVTQTFSDLVILIAGIFVETEHVAIIGVCIRIAVFVGFAGQICHQLVIPDLTSAMAAGDNSSRLRILFRANILSIAAPVTILILAVFFGHQILGVFGAEYTSGYPILLILLFSPLIRSSFGINVYLLSFEGKQAQTGVACAVSVVVLLVSAGFLSMTFGAEGLAVGVVVSDLSWAIGVSILARRTLDMPGDVVSLVRQKLQFATRFSIT